jgi:putative nucleotidyltransferase with HDIG domain
MKGIEGDLGLMSLPDIMQWAELNNKSGTLILERQGIAKRFYFQDGKIIFVSSQKEGERVGDFFARLANLGAQKVKEMIQESQRLGIPFTGYLLSEKMVGMNRLEEIIQELAETILVDALSWDSGKFRFTGEIPVAVQNGPVKLSTSLVVFQAIKLFDELRHKKTVPDQKELVRGLAQRIAAGDIELPIIPDIMVKLNRYIQDDDVSVHDIAKLIMSDQILTAKILKVVNSSFYSPPCKITSLQEAIIYMGFKAILSIVTACTFSKISPRNAGKVREILLHSLVCAFIAKKLAVDIRTDPEEAFVCGLLHDIGKTVLLNILPDYRLSKEMVDALTEECHPHAGLLLATKWKLSDEVRFAARYHHCPENAPSHKKIVEVISLANRIENSSGSPEIFPGSFPSIKIEDVNVKGILDDLMNVRETVKVML